MRIIRLAVTNFLVSCFTVFIFLGAVIAEEKKYSVTFEYFEKQKRFWDDPRPFLLNNPIKSIMPPEEYAKIIRADVDVEARKKMWADLVGFKSPDVVGKIAPEIKPGKYTEKDKEKFPGLKELMVPIDYDLFFQKPGPPTGFTFNEFEVVPTEQFYWRPNVAEATKKYEGTVKLDEKGYIIDETYVAGYPFPKPSGKFKAQQIIYNWKKHYNLWDNFSGICTIVNVDRNFREISRSSWEYYQVKLLGRVDSKPWGPLDKRAEERRELRIMVSAGLSPRDQAGNVTWFLERSSHKDTNQVAIWYNILRRLRKLSGTDTQDTFPGANLIYDDQEMFTQSLDPKLFPYEFRLIEEREFLTAHYTRDGAEYITKNNEQRKNVRMQRRPMWVIEMKQKDPTYVYGKRVFYIDRETFEIYWVLNYDQNGRLWRGMSRLLAFNPEISSFVWINTYQIDVLDKQWETQYSFDYPTPYLTRDQVSLDYIKKLGK